MILISNPHGTDHHTDIDIVAAYADEFGHKDTCKIYKITGCDRYVGKLHSLSHSRIFKEFVGETYEIVKIRTSDRKNIYGNTKHNQECKKYLNGYALTYLVYLKDLFNRIVHTLIILQHQVFKNQAKIKADAQQTALC